MIKEAVAAQSGGRWMLAGVVLLVVSMLLYAATGAVLYIALPFASLFIAVLLLDWKTAWWVMLCSVPFSMEISLGNNLSTSMPDEVMTWMLFLSLLIGWAANPRLLRSWWWRHPITLIVALQLLWTIVAVCYSRVGVLSAKFLLAKCWFLSCFFVLPAIIFQTKEDFKKAFLLLLLPMLATMLIITARHAAVGFTFTDSTKVIGGIYNNHVDYSSVVSMFFPLLFVAWPLINKNKRGLRILLTAVILFFALVILITYARAALLGLAFAGIVAIAIRRKVAQLVMPVCYAIIASVLIYLVPNNRFMVLKPDYEHTYMHDKYSEHMSATFKGRDLSSMERLYRWIAAMRMSRAEPLTGFGPHAFYYYYKPYAISAFRTYTSDNPEHSTTHNYFLLMLTEQGWPAMLLYALLMAVALRQAQAIYHRFSDRFYKCATMGIALLLAVNFVNNFFSELIETHKVGALFYIALSLLVVLDWKSRQEATGSGQEAVVSRQE